MLYEVITILLREITMDDFDTNIVPFSHEKGAACHGTCSAVMVVITSKDGECAGKMKVRPWEKYVRINASGRSASLQYGQRRGRRKTAGDVADDCVAADSGAGRDMIRESPACSLWVRERRTDREFTERERGEFRIISLQGPEHPQTPSPGRRKQGNGRH